MPKHYYCPECGRPMTVTNDYPKTWECKSCNGVPDHKAILDERDQERANVMGRGDEPMVETNRRRYGHKPPQP